MTLTQDQLDKIKDCLPVQRKSEKVKMIDFLNAVLYIIENGCNGMHCPKNSVIGIPYIRGLIVGVKTTLLKEYLLLFRMKIS